MKKSVLCIICLLALLFSNIILANQTRKVICEDDPVEECFKKDSKKPIPTNKCPTRKGWVIVKIPDCKISKQGPTTDTETVSSDSPTSGQDSQ